MRTSAKPAFLLPSTIAAVVASLLFVCSTRSQTSPPKPYGPLPTPAQLQWQSLECCAFLHFSMNTFTGKEWGYGDEPESLFNPSEFNAEKIVRGLQEVGMKGVILTCKHHDGFCLWPTGTTEHSVKKSGWKNGKGDVVRELSDACRRLGMKFGVYLSPWDRNSAVYGTPAYLEVYRKQLTELLTNYGEIFEVWFDGANGGDGYYGGARESRVIDRKSYYHWQETWDIVRKLQPNAVIFSDGGPDVRWVGDEDGYAGETNWSLLRRDEVYPGYDKYTELISGHADGTHWVPAECDVSIRPGWFYHSEEDRLVKSNADLFKLYLQSVGRNASMLLNIPPTRRGLIHENDLDALNAFRAARDYALKTDLALNATASASEVRGSDDRYGAGNVSDGDEQTYWTVNDSTKRATLTLEFTRPLHFDVLLLSEFIELGQRVEDFSVDAWNGSAWIHLTTGTTIGHKRILNVPPTDGTKIRLNINRSRACPLISRFSVYDSRYITDGTHVPPPIH